MRPVAYLAESAPEGALRVRDLGQALELIAAGRADTLYVARLGALAGSLGELTRLLDWLTANGAELIAADVGLDTRTPSGRRSVRLLREIAAWERERPRGRPGIAKVAPHVAERIARLRERGLSLHAIAAQLNAEGVPTPRGGARWRASSVQSAIGYRRPKPPPPGAPRRRPPHKHPRGPRP